MYKEHRITVVVPAYNEEKLIGKVIESMPELVDRILIIDDCSKDKTQEMALSQGDSRVSIFQTPHNMGVGGAMVFGYQKALEEENHVVVKMDGDGQMSPEYLPAFLDTLIDENWDYVKGNRFLVPEALPKMPLPRLLGNIALTFMTKMASGYWNIFDPQNGYTALKTTVLKKMDLDSLYRGYFFENDMLFQLNIQGARVKDIPMASHYGEETSKMSLSKVVLVFPFLLLNRFFKRIFKKYILLDFSPIALFFFSGLFLFGWGFFFGAYIWTKAYFTQIPTPTGTIMLVVLPLILGFQLLLQAIVLDIQETPK